MQILFIGMLIDTYFIKGYVGFTVYPTPSNLYAS